jgi:hypothetical protein
MSKEALMRKLITKNEISVHEVSLMPNVLLTLWKEACVSLIAMLEIEQMLLTSVEVKAIALADIKMAKKNLSTIRSIDKLNSLRLGNVNLN